MNCCICDKKPSVLSNDFPLSPSMPNLRVCATCSSRLKLSNFEPDKKYLLSYISSGGVDSETISLIKRRISEVEHQQQVVIKKTEQAVAEVEGLNFISSFSTSGFNFEGYKITKYLGATFGESMYGTGMWSESSAKVADFWGIEETDGYFKKVQKARNSAFEKLKKNALAVGANALIGLSFNNFVIGQNMITVTATATAVVIEKL